MKLIRNSINKTFKQFFVKLLAEITSIKKSLGNCLSSE